MAERLFDAGWTATQLFAAVEVVFCSASFVACRVGLAELDDKLG